MSPRQFLRARELRAPDSAKGQSSDRQVRASSMTPGLQDVNAEEFLNTVLSRIRLNAGATDWRIGPVPGAGSGTDPGTSPTIVREIPDGDKDGLNCEFLTTAAFYPQTLKFYVNGLLQALDADGDADFTISESQGDGAGYDIVTLAWAPLAQDKLFVEYQPTPQSD